MRSRIAFALTLMAGMGWLCSAQAGIVVLNGVPDWHQPYDTYVPPGPDPNVALPINPYDNFCTPTAAANLLGWWEDMQGFTGLTDRQVAPLTAAFANNIVAPTWQQGLWHDGNIELGWYLDTNDVDPAKYALPDGHLGTRLVDIAPGLMTYSSGAWADASSGLQKVAYNANAWSINGGNLPVQTTAWDDYVADIDAGKPTLIDFDYWNPVNPVVNPLYPQVDSFYAWGPHPGDSLGHTVTGVGYLDMDGLNNTDWDKFWIVHDNWSSTAATIAIPYWDVAGGSAYNWQQTDHMTVIPEPGTIALFFLTGLGAAIARRRRLRLMV